MVLEATTAFTPSDSLHIKDWAEQDRPREKLLQKGKAALSDAELLAILLRSGTNAQSAVALAQRILQHAHNNLHELASFTAADFLKIKGVGEAKATALVAALELGRRRRSEERIFKQPVATSRAAYNAVRAELSDLHHEQFWVVFLSRGNSIVGKRLVAQGGQAEVSVDPKVIFRHALDDRACGIILAHNHPSGNKWPSPHDLALTQKIKAGAALLDMQVMDHIIVAGENYFSFADEGML